MSNETDQRRKRIETYVKWGLGLLGALRGCILDHVDELKETTGTHPKWQAVDPANHGKWAWYVLPETKKNKRQQVSLLGQ